MACTCYQDLGPVNNPSIVVGAILPYSCPEGCMGFCTYVAQMVGGVMTWVLSSSTCTASTTPIPSIPIPRTPTPVGCAAASIPMDLNLRRGWAAIAFGNNILVAIAGKVDNTTLTSNSAAYSTDNGISWTNTVLPGDYNWISVVYVGEDLGFFAIAIDGKTATNTGMQANWTNNNPLPSGYSWKKIVYNDINKTFSAISNGYDDGYNPRQNISNKLAYRKHGNSGWTLLTLPSLANWQDLIYQDGVYVAIGYNGEAITSKNPASDSFPSFRAPGITPPSDGFYRAVAYSKDLATITATGDSGVCAVSTNFGEIWSRHSRSSSSAVYSLAFGNGYFFCVTQDGKVERSTDGVNWESFTPSNKVTNIGSTIFSGGFFYHVQYDFASTFPDGVKFACESAPTTPTPTPTPTPTNTFNVVNDGSGAYLINGQTNLTITLTEGISYTFNINAPGHPFLIKTVKSTGIENSYNIGVINNGAENGIITFDVPYDAPSILYYNCQFHASMAGNINIINATPTPSTQSVKNFGVRCAISGDGSTMIAVQSNLDSDTAFIYKFISNAWILYQEINHATTLNNFILMSCAIDNTGNRIIIGYTHTEIDINSQAERTCSLYVYAITDIRPAFYEREAILNPGIALTSISEYGASCALSESGDRIIVSLPKLALQKTDGTVGNAGALYYYKRTGVSWRLDSQLKVREPQKNDYLGRETSCAISGRTSVGLGGISNRNLVAVFDLTAPSTIVPDSLMVGDKYGSTVKISQDGLTAMLAAAGHLQKAGSVYIYSRNQNEVFYDYITVNAEDQSSNDRFGSALATTANSNTIIIGADNADEKGAVYVFRGSGKLWAQTQKLTTTTSYSNQLGYSLSIAPTGSYLYVGAPADSPSGAVYVFKSVNNNYISLSKMVPSDAATFINMSFGFSIASATSYDQRFERIICVGAPDRSDRDGAVYVFGQISDTVNELFKIGHPYRLMATSFGKSVLLSSDGRYLFIGAPGQDSNLGTVFVYTYNQARQEMAFAYSLSPSLPGFFGDKLSLSADNRYLYVSAANTDWNMQTNNGAAYVYRLEEGTISSKYTLCNILLSDRQNIDELFGYDISADLRGKSVIVGAPGGLNSRGLSYIFRKSNFYLKNIYSSESTNTAEFGNTIVNDDDMYRVLIGASKDQVNGRVYYYKRESSIWTKQQQILPGIPSTLNDSDFGCSIDADYYLLSMVVGYKGYSGDYLRGGVAIVYMNIEDSWEASHYLRPDDPCVDSRFGTSLAMSGDANMIAVGATGSLNAFGQQVGAIYLYYLNGTYPLIARFSPSELTLNSEFGSTCSMTKDGTRLIVGAPNQGFNGSTGIGEVFTYELIGGEWAYKQKIISGLLPINQIYEPFRFGHRVKYGQNGKIAVVSSQATVNNVITTGDIFIFRSDSENTLVLESHITPPIGAFFDMSRSLAFGESIAISEDENTILIGSPKDYEGGSILRFDYINNMWIQTAKFKGDMTTNRGLGVAASISADKNFIVGGASAEGTVGNLVVYSAD